MPVTGHDIVVRSHVYLQNQNIRNGLIRRWVRHMACLHHLVQQLLVIGRAVHKKVSSALRRCASE